MLAERQRHEARIVRSLVSSHESRVPQRGQVRMFNLDDDSQAVSQNRNNEDALVDEVAEKVILYNWTIAHGPNNKSKPKQRTYLFNISSRQLHCT